MGSIVALIPARSGSRRIPNKNIKRLGKHPLLAYTIEQARQSGIFDEIIVSTDSQEYMDIAWYYHKHCYFVNRNPEYSKDDSPDIEWIKEVFKYYNDNRWDYFAILRPTNPFRTVVMLQCAWYSYQLKAQSHWLKGVEPVEQHPGKMWNINGFIMYPAVNSLANCHMKQTNTLPEIYVQNGSIEIRPTNDLEPTIKQPFITHDYEGYDLNTEKDWIYAEWLIANGKVKLIDIDKEPYEPSV